MLENIANPSMNLTSVCRRIGIERQIIYLLKNFSRLIFLAINLWHKCHPYRRYESESKHFYSVILKTCSSSLHSTYYKTNNKIRLNACSYMALYRADVLAIVSTKSWFFCLSIRFVYAHIIGRLSLINAACCSYSWTENYLVKLIEKIIFSTDLTSSFLPKEPKKNNMNDNVIKVIRLENKDNSINDNWLFSFILSTLLL